MSFNRSLSSSVLLIYLLASVSSDWAFILVFDISCSLALILSNFSIYLLTSVSSTWAFISVSDIAVSFLRKSFNFLL